jgi:hypothetical protein
MAALDVATVAETLGQPLASTADASALRVMPYLSDEKFE